MECLDGLGVDIQDGQRLVKIPQEVQVCEGSGSMFWLLEKGWCLGV